MQEWFQVSWSSSQHSVVHLAREYQKPIYHSCIQFVSGERGMVKTGGSALEESLGTGTEPDLNDWEGQL